MNSQYKINAFSIFRPQFLVHLGLLSLLVSCQTLKAGLTNSKSSEVSAKSHKEMVKEQKRLQSEADLPFRGLDTSIKIQQIAFGANAQQNLPQPIWSTVLKNNPDLFLFAGDTVTNVASGTEKKSLSEAYKKLNKITEYRQAREKIPFMAIWNHDDFGLNENEVQTADKETVRKDFVKNWSYLNFTLPNNQKALYHSKIFGQKKQLVQIIMLDTRWDQSELKKKADLILSPESTNNVANNVTTNTPSATPSTTAETASVSPMPVTAAQTTNNSDAQKPETSAANKQQPAVAPNSRIEYSPDSDNNKHFLSSAQWNWLESELKKPAALRILVSPIPVIAQDHHDEKWGNFPQEREKLLTLFKKTHAKNLLIVSGGRRLTALAKTDLKGLGTIYDVTAGNLNQETPAYLSRADSTYLAEAYSSPHFGLIKINWNNRKALVELRSSDDLPKQTVEISF